MSTSAVVRILRFEVISDPVAKARPRVAVRGGRAHAYTPAKTQDAEWRIRSRFMEWFPGHRPLTGPIDLSVVAYVKMPASIPKRYRDTALPTKRPDCDNYLKTVLDALNGVAFVDDSQVVTASLSKRYAGPEMTPGWAITIADLSPSQPAAPPTIPAQEAADAAVSGQLR